MEKQILVSACLAGVCCRMDGKSKPVKEIVGMAKEGKCILICPEVLGGLPTPRPSSEICCDSVINTEGKDVTEQFVLGARNALEIARKNGCTKAILKSKSPSCGIGQVYDGTFTRTLVEGDGITARLLRENGISVYTEHEIEKCMGD